ncbi:MAG: c-type cytochrome [Pirellulaceae bacterium]|nr:c-type cytochrome [Pirellulaceae bacterium]
MMHRLEQRPHGWGGPTFRKCCRGFLGLALLSLFPGSAKPIDEAESLVLLVKALSKSDNSDVQAALLRGMLSGLEGRRQVTAPAGWDEVGAALARSSDAQVQELSQQLAQIFGDRNAMQQALATVRDSSADLLARRRALRMLLTQRNDEASLLLEPLLDELPLQLDAIRGYAMMENAAAPAVLLGRYPQLLPEHQRAVLETLATRKEYAQALLTALRQEKVPLSDLPVHVARSLQRTLGDPFVKVYGEVRPIGEDREKLLAKYTQLITAEALAKADAVRGRGIFQKTCAACHTLYGSGGKIGPDLTGSNRANLAYLLLNSVDPSYDVADSYKMISILTVDGQILNGVLAEENGSRVVLKTVEQPRLVILKQDIDERSVSSKSMMPDGQLEKMKPQEVLDLIKYLRTTEQVELPK